MADSQQPNSSSASSHSVKARAIIEDAFRRADKNDDGSLSLDEFHVYFDDSVVTREDLNELFHTIDTHRSGNIDVGELCEYFSQYWVPFEESFATINDLTISITKVLHVIAQEYATKNKYEKFAMRFLIKEMVHHINTLEKTLDMSMESLEENERSDTVSELVQVKDIEDDGIKPRWREKLNRSLSSNTEASSNNDVETASGLLSKVSALIDRLEKKVVSLQPFDEEVITQGKKATVLVVSYTVEYASEKMNEFRSVVQDYVKKTQSQSDCYHIGIRSVTDTSIITIYEVWRDEISWDKYWCTNSLQSLAGDLLAKSHQVQKMDIPDSWWPFAVMD